MMSAAGSADTPAPWDVVFFSSVDFSSHAQRAQAVARELAVLGARVLYVDNLGLRTPRFADRERVRRRVRSATKRRPAPTANASALADRAPGITVLSPVVPPWRLFEPATRRWLSRRIRAWRAGDTARPLVVWTYLPNPVIAQIAETENAAALVYEYADLASVRLHVRSERHRQRVAAWEDTMFARSTSVFVPTERLMEARHITVKTAHVIPHGMPSVVAGTGRRVWDDEQRWPRPRVAFVGSISPVVDIGLLDDLASSRPDWSFIVVGPARVRVDELARHPNVLITGERDQDDVTALLAECDVGIIPYRTTAPGIDTVSPLKLQDYLAQGLPVVSVDIPGARGLPDDVQIAAGAQEFGDAIERAVIHGRRAAPRLRSWAAAVGEMVERVRETVP